LDKLIKVYNESLTIVIFWEIIFQPLLVYVYFHGESP